MRSVTAATKGGPEVLRVVDLPPPLPAPDQVLVDVAVAGVNFLDVYHRTGHSPLHAPFILGVEGVGTVSSVGCDVREIPVGSRVGWVQIPGAYAEHVVIPATRAIPIPDGVRDDQAAAALIQGMTAQYLASDAFRVAPGVTVFVHDAAEGARHLLVQLAKLRGARVLATASSDAGVALVREAGADEVYHTPDADLVERVRVVTSGQGVDVVFDGVGAPTLETSLSILRIGGLFVTFAEIDGPLAPIDPMRLAQGSFFMTRPLLSHHIKTRAALLARSSEVLGRIADGTLRLRIGRRYPLEDAAGAHRDLEARRNDGKLLIMPRIAAKGA